MIEGVFVLWFEGEACGETETYNTASKVHDESKRRN